MRTVYTGLSRILSTGLVVLCALVIVAGGAVQGHASKANLTSVAAAKATAAPNVILTQGMAEIVNIEGPISDIMVANPSLVDVMVLQSNRLYIVGVNLGTTNIIVVDSEGNIVSRMNVHVKIDDVAIQNTITRLFPNEDVKIVSTAQQVMLTGQVSTPDVAQKIASIVGQFVSSSGGGSAPDSAIVNMLSVAGEQQVMLRVKVVEAARDVLRELGIDTDIPGFSKASVNGVAGTDGTVLGLTTDPLGLATIFYDTGTALGTVDFAISALEDRGIINTLAEPNLTAISGEQAGFLAGGEFPIPASRDQNGNVVIDYRPFGVALNFRPVVLSADRISLQLQTEVSSISNQNSLNVNQLQIPGFAVRRAETTVELGSGGSLMIAGLLQSEVTKGMSDLPGINNIPILGKLASSESFRRQETELIVIVTAYLVKPYGDRENNAKVVPKQASNPLAAVFADNIKRTYAKLALAPELFENNEGFGYLID